MSERSGFVYGFGSTKHLRDTTGTKRNAYRRYEPGEDVALCGAYGGGPVEPSRPLCKHCERIERRMRGAK